MIMADTEIRLILGDQLNIKHSWFKKAEPHVVYVLMEIRQETDYVLHHAQKIIAIFAAMRAFAELLTSKNHRVHYLTISDKENCHSLTENLDKLIKHYQANYFRWQLPDEYRLNEQLNRYANTLKITSEVVDSEHFYSSREQVAQFLQKKS